MVTEMTEKEARKIEKERGDFKLLVAENPNYFGNLANSPFKPVKKIIASTKYEELTCVGFNPDTNLLEATIAVKLPFGYNGNLCQFGSNEYVRFFVDYGGGWIDNGVVAVSSLAWNTQWPSTCMTSPPSRRMACATRRFCRSI